VPRFMAGGEEAGVEEEANRSSSLTWIRKAATANDGRTGALPSTWRIGLSAIRSSLRGSE
jgi:hypothetical protein